MNAPLSAEQNRPVLDKDEETQEWVLKVDCAPWIRIPVAQRQLALDVMSAATWAYQNGRRDVQKQLKAALGIYS